MNTRWQKGSLRTHEEDNIAVLHIIFIVSKGHCRLDDSSRVSLTGTMIEQRVDKRVRSLTTLEHSRTVGRGIRTLQTVMSTSH